MGNQYKIDKSFKSWCIENNHQDYLDMWDYNLNNVDPENIGFQSNKKFWFNCSNHNHKPFQKNIMVIAREENASITCPYCNSIGQYMIDTYGEDTYKSYWSDKNTEDQFNYPKCSNKKVWIKCIKGHPDYEQICYVVSKGIGCPYCSGRKVCKENSLGFLFPESLDYWSDKNEKTPFDYTASSGQKVFWKCKDGVHDDYLRKINGATHYDFRCRLCSIDKMDKTGDKNHFWKGGVSKDNDVFRHRKEYKRWRSYCYKRDNYTCQCCGKYSGKLRCHHILNFANNIDLRLDINNGITMCENCHDSIKQGSLHNIYGTYDVTPEQLEEYINNKRKELGINIPFNIEEYKNGNILKPNMVDIYKTS